MPPAKRKISERFRPQFMFTLDQIALILAVPNDHVFDYVWTPYSKGQPGRRMQATEIVNFYGKKELRVSESQLVQWADLNGYSAFVQLV